jgi:hypothetical protein
MFIRSLSTHAAVCFGTVLQKQTPLYKTVVELKEASQILNPNIEVDQTVSKYIKLLHKIEVGCLYADYGQYFQSQDNPRLAKSVMSVLATIDHSKVSEFMWEVMEKTHNANYLVGLNLNGPLETNPSIQYEVPLNEAVKSGILASVIGLLHFGANPNIPDLNGNTALHLACENGELNIVTELVRNKADPEAINKACKA